MKNSLLGKVALVTGGTSGIGEEIARVLLTSGCRVFISYHQDDARAKKSVAMLAKINAQAKVHLLKADVASEKEMTAAFEKIEKETQGQLDFVINNAGTDIVGEIESIKIADFRRVIDVNVVGKVITTKLAIPMLKQSKTPRIINIASRLATRPMSESTSYCCGEAAIVMLTQVSALELSKYGIKINTVSPAMTLTPLTVQSYTKDEREAYVRKNPSGRMGTVSDVANLVMYLLSPEAEFINGENININGGILLI